MLDRILRNAQSGVTVIEEESGSVSRILAKQLAGYAKAEGKRVAFLSFGTEDRPVLERNPKNGEVAEDELEEVDEDIGTGSSVFYTTLNQYSFFKGMKYQVIVIDSFSTYLFDKSEKEAQEAIKQIAKISRDEQKNFIITYDRALLSERTAAFLNAVADTVIVVKVDLTVDRVTRMLYVPKLKDSKPMDRLIKITLDDSGVQVDTREFVG